MDVFLIKATQLILALAFLVIIHEFGHFFFARIFGVKVEKFYIFFNPKFSILKWKPGHYFSIFGRTKKLKKAEEIERREAEIASKEEADANHALSIARAECAREGLEGEKMEKEALERAGQLAQKNPDNIKRPFWKDTEYGLGWVPLGGYCKIAGMIDESMDTEQMAKPPKHWEFRAKPAWQRLLVMIAGVLFNFLLAILIYAGLVYATGEKYVPMQNADMGMAYSDVAHKAGFRDGDIPVAADGKTLSEYPNEARMEMLNAKSVTVLREGEKVELQLPAEFVADLDKELKDENTAFSFMTYRIPARITQLANGEGAEKGGIKIGDRILSVDGVETPTLFDFTNSLEGKNDKTVSVVIIRPLDTDPAKINSAKCDTITKEIKLNGGAKMGVGLELDPSAFYVAKEKRYNLVESIPRGIEVGTSTLTNYAKSMKHVFTKEGAQSIGGFGAIGSIFPEKWNWIAFWNIAAFLSVALAFMNILPIPALDGGHVLFLLYEVITRRKPSEKFMEYAQIVGMSLLILLLIYANGMDIVRLFK